MRVPGSRMWAVLPTTVLLRCACADVFAVLFELGYNKRKTQNGSKGVGQYCVLQCNGFIRPQTAVQYWEIDTITHRHDVLNYIYISVRVQL